MVTLLRPLARIFEVFALIENRWSLTATFTGEDVVRAEPFPAAEIDLASIWGADEV